MASDGNALTGLWFDGQKFFPEMPVSGYLDQILPVFEDTVRWLDCYFSGRIPEFIPAMNPNGSVFRRTVWDILLTIPAGRTLTYGRIAEKIADRTGKGRMSAQAVGGAVARNAIMLIIPCHRVVGAGGSLTGYAGGLDRKARLLQMEQAMISRNQAQEQVKECQKAK